MLCIVKTKKIVFEERAVQASTTLNIPFHLYQSFPFPISNPPPPFHIPIPTNSYLPSETHFAPTDSPLRSSPSRLFRPSTIGSCRAFRPDRPQSDRVRISSGLEFEELVRCVELRLFLWVSCVYHVCRVSGGGGGC